MAPINDTRTVTLTAPVVGAFVAVTLLTENSVYDSAWLSDDKNRDPVAASVALPSDPECALLLMLLDDVHTVLK